MLIKMLLPFLPMTFDFLKGYHLCRSTKFKAEKLARFSKSNKWLFSEDMKELDFKQITLLGSFTLCFLSS